MQPMIWMGMAIWIFWARPTMQTTSPGGKIPMGMASSWSTHTVAASFGAARSVYAADVDGDGDYGYFGRGPDCRRHHLVGKYHWGWLKLEYTYRGCLF